MFNTSLGLGLQVVIADSVGLSMLLDSSMPTLLSGSVPQPEFDFS